MYRFLNIKSQYGKFSYYSNYINSFHMINLGKYDSYPSLSEEFKKNVPTNILVSSGKLSVNIHDIKTKKNIYLYAGKNNLIKNDKDGYIFLTNKPYVLTIAPSMLYSFYSCEYDTIFQMFFKSDDNIKYYTYTENQCKISNINYLN